MLGYCYKSGIGTTFNIKKAFELYERAANLKNKVAQYNLALMYENEDNNIDKAIYWYEKSAEQGLQNAQYNLANIYYKNEIGTSIDNNKAFNLYQSFKFSIELGIMINLID